MASALGLAMPWASLRAPVEMGNAGAAWFEVVTPGNTDAERVVTATDTIWNWVEENVALSVRVVPIGFSQGGLMASQLLCTRPERVAATVVLGGFVLGAEQPGDVALAESRPAVLWGRGAEDQVIGAAAIARTTDFLPRHSTLEEHVYPGLAHGIHNTELEDLRRFLITQLCADVVNNR